MDPAPAGFVDYLPGHNTSYKRELLLGYGADLDSMMEGETSLHWDLRSKGHKLYLYGHNPLMRLGYAGTIGLKTGYTNAAGRCFVGVVRRHGRTLGVVLLNSRDPAKHAPKLLDAAFARL